MSTPKKPAPKTKPKPKPNVISGVGILPAPYPGNNSSTPNYDPWVIKDYPLPDYSWPGPARTLPTNAPITINTPPPSGTTSRAYANARGSQAGLGVPNSSNATQGQGYIPAASSALGGGSSSGGGTTGVLEPAAPLFTPAIADLSKNPYPGFYDKLLEYVQANANSRPGEYAAVGETFKANQAQANKQMYDMYMGSRAETDASATALGFDPAVISQARDLAMRKNQENSDQSLADNLAWLTKMGVLSKQQGEAFLNQYAGEKATKSAGWDAAEQQRVADANLVALQALVDQQAAASKSSGGGGGRRSGGGSSSSGNAGTTTSTITDTITDTGFQRALAELAISNPEAAALLQNAENLSGTDSSTVKLLQQSVNDSGTPKLSKSEIMSQVLPWSYNTTAKASIKKKTDAAKKQKALYQAALDKAMSIAKNRGTPTTVSVNKSTAKVKN